MPVLRREQPVVRVESERYRPFWAVTRHADVLDVERDHEHFRNAPRPLLVPAVMEARAEASGQMLRTLIHMDDPDHKAFRGIASSWFLPGRIRALEDRIRELAIRSIDHMAELGGTCDFAQDVAVGFPLHVILSTLGLPEEDFPRMLQLTTERSAATTTSSPVPATRKSRWPSCSTSSSTSWRSLPSAARTRPTTSPRSSPTPPSRASHSTTSTPRRTT